MRINKFLDQVVEEYEWLSSPLSKATKNVIVVKFKEQSYWLEYFRKKGYILDANLTRQARVLASFENSNFVDFGYILTKTEIPLKEDAIITWVTENIAHLDTFKIFVNSIEYCGFKGNVIYCTNDLSIETRRSLNGEIIDFGNIHELVKDRFLAWNNLLTEREFNRVLLVDSRDVVFNSNPFDIQTSDEFLWLCKEGMKHRDSEWNSQDQKIFQESHGFNLDYADWNVVNAGVIFGDANSIKDLCLDIWALAYCSSGTDQAALNYLAHTYKFDFPKYALTGEALKNGFIKYEHLPIFHQYDRTEYLEFYKETFIYE